MFTLKTISILAALQFNAAPVSSLEIPAGDLGGVGLQTVKGLGTSCAVVIRTDSGAVRTRSNHRTSSKHIYYSFNPHEGGALETSLIPIDIMPPGWASQENVVVLSDVTSIIIDISQFDPSKVNQPVGVFADHHFNDVAVCDPASCTCSLAN
jgi:hypothetical protein